MYVHLVDGTFELFRAYYGSPPSTDCQRQGGRRGARPRALDARVARRARRHARRHRVRSRHRVVSQRLVPRLQDRRRHRPGAVRAVRLGRGRRAARSGIVTWPMIEFECDDALATAAARFAASAAVERVVICSPDKDLTQCVQGDRVVCFDRMRRKRLDERGVVEKFGVYPKSIPDWLALVGDSADGYPGVPRWGAKSAAAVLGAYEKLEAIPADAARVARRRARRAGARGELGRASHRRLPVPAARDAARRRAARGVARRFALARAGYGGARRARGAVGRRRDRRACNASRAALATAT